MYPMSIRDTLGIRPCPSVPISQTDLGRTSESNHGTCGGNMLEARENLEHSEEVPEAVEGIELKDG
jgi:hypothetical protein